MLRRENIQTTAAKLDMRPKSCFNIKNAASRDGFRKNPNFVQQDTYGKETAGHMRCKGKLTALPVYLVNCELSQKCSFECEAFLLFCRLRLQTIGSINRIAWSRTRFLDVFLTSPDTVDFGKPRAGKVIFKM